MANEMMVMKRRIKISKEVGMNLKHDETLVLTQVESEGETLEDLINNSMLYVEDWNGNDMSDMALTVDGLRESDYQVVIGILAEAAGL